jgi:hypothetical protein
MKNVLLKILYRKIGILVYPDQSLNERRPDRKRLRPAIGGARAPQTDIWSNCVNRLFLLASAAICLTAPASAQITSFKHIIVVVQEN